MTQAGKKYSLVFLCSLLAACEGGSGVGLDLPSPNDNELEATLSSIQENVFSPGCATAGCHSGGSAPLGLSLDAGTSFDLLVGIASAEVPALLRVAPGDPDNSYLIQKLEGSAAVGAQMPLNGTPLSPQVIAVVRQWIADGAIDDSGASNTPIRVTSISPQPGIVVETPPLAVRVTFDRPPDASTLNALTVSITRSGNDGTFNDGNEVALTATSIDLVDPDGRSAFIGLPDTGLAADTYRVVLSGSGPSLILDLDANALDGEFEGTFPSGDGVPGGDFVMTFVLDSSPPAGATLPDIQASIFTPTCATSNCHAGAAPAQGLNLEDGQSFNSLVGVSSSQAPAVLRVSAGDANNSYLVQKLEGTAGGMQMPFGGPPLSPGDIARIREWIDNGALP